MKSVFRIVLTISCVLQLQLASAQSAELQQLILNVEKLSQLKKILAGMKSTYDIIFKGYERIKGLTRGNFSLHSIFLDGLLQVSPEIRNYKKVGDIITCQLLILKEYKLIVKKIKHGSVFTVEEANSLMTAFQSILKLSISCIEELTMTVTSGQLRMSDDERISAIDRQYETMKDAQFRLRKMNSQVLSIESSRSRLATDAGMLKELFK